MDRIRGKILVVDDEPEMCRLLSDVLTEEGHTVEAGRGKKLPRVREFEDSLESP